MKKFSYAHPARVFIALIVFILFSCGQGPKEKTTSYERPVSPETPEVVIEKEEIVEEELPPVETPQFQQGMITFFTGDVYVGDGSDWYPVVIGDFVEQDETVKVEIGGYCEVQFGETAVVRLQEETVIKLSKINVTPGKADVGLKVAAGSVMSKVNKLAGGERFKISTQSSVCGVRGTEFLVSVSDGTQDADTTIAVKEGAVAVLPLEADLDDLKEKVTQAGNQADSINKALDAIAEAAPVIEANQQIVLNKKDSKETVKALTEVVETIEKMIVGKEINEEETAAIAATIKEQAVEIKEQAEPAKKELSSDNQETLAILDEVEVIAILAAPKTEDSEEKQTPVAPLLNRIALDVSPSDAAIILNGKEVGRGNFARVYPQNRNLVFTIQKNGYKDSTLRVDTSGTNGKSFSVRMEKIPEPEIIPETIIINTTPSDAEILLSGEVVGTGSYTIEREPGSSLSFEVKKEGYETEKLALDIKEGSGKSYSIVLKEIPKEEEVIPEKEVSIIVSPASATISIDGKVSGTGKAQGTWQEGTSLTVSFSRRGFATKTETIAINAETETPLRFELTPQPLEHRVNLSGAPQIRSVVSTGKITVSADSSGTITAASLDGEKLWSITTGNSPNENCRPVIDSGRVYFSGAKELVIANLNDGSILYRQEIESKNSHMFGRRITPLGSTIAFPTNASLEIRNSETGSIQNTILIPGGSKMSASLYGQTLVIADQRGILYRLNKTTGAVEKEIPTGALQPVALAPVIKDNFAIFAGRKGIITCVDLENGRKVWEEDVSGGRSLGVYTDIEAGESGVYMYARNTLFGFDIKTGAALFPPITEVTAAPAYSGGKLYYGTGSRLAVADASNGRLLGSVDVGSTLSTRPAVTGGTLTVGTNKGELLVVVTESLQ